MSQIKISIIVCVYNGERFLPVCLNSLVHQSLKELEIVCVDDGSTDRTLEVLKEYSQRDKRLKIVSHSKNLGLYQARISGMREAKGDWITFVDADDRVSLDRFRLMVQKGETENADMVFGDVLMEYNSSIEKRYCSIFETRQKVLEQPELMELFFNQAGSDWECHITCNKIYREPLVKQYLLFSEKQKMHLVMCEDVVFSVCAFLYARKMAFVHDAPYYYNKKNTDASTSASGITSFKKFYKIADDINKAFACSLLALERFNKLEYRSFLYDWRKKIAMSWARYCNAFPKKQKVILLKTLFGYEYDDFSNSTEDKSYELYDKQISVYDGGLDSIREKIASPNVKVVSFDVFDTLLLRPFYYPVDLFEFVGNRFAKKFNINSIFEFKDLRIQAEKNAREKVKTFEPNIDDIYIELKLITGFSSEQINFCKDVEHELELKFCKRREVAFLLYQFAKAIGKKVIAISDMYFSKTFLRELLKKSGYEIDDVYVSCDKGLSKSSGKLYTFVAKDLGVSRNSFLHIGDNYDSDVENARKRGFDACFLPKTTACFDALLKKLLPNAWGNRSMAFTCYHFSGIRCMWAIIANKLFDNPFYIFPAESLFGGNPFIFGYFGLGMHLLAVSQWIQREVEKNHYTGIHFLYRDGYLAERAYELMFGDSAKSVPHNMWYLNRLVANQLSMKNKFDLLTLFSFRASYSLTIGNVITIFNGIIPRKQLEYIKFLLSKKFPLDRILDEHEAQRFIKIFLRCFSALKVHLEKYQESIITTLEKEIFGANDATFDIGYSCRVESILKRWGITVNPLYIHTNEDIAFMRAYHASLSINTFYDYMPFFTGSVRELCFSAVQAKCTCYRLENNVARPCFSIPPYDFNQAFLLSLIQQSALEFCQDWKDTFKDVFDELHYRYSDASIFFEQFLHRATPLDCNMMSILRFEDDLSSRSGNRVSDFWNDFIAASRDSLQTSSGASSFVALQESVINKKPWFVILAKNIMPYGIMCSWIRYRYNMEEDLPLFAYPGMFKGIRRMIKFVLPFGLVMKWKKR